jgi:DNA-binding NarL/FixJ family response regulator
VVVVSRSVAEAQRVEDLLEFLGFETVGFSGEDGSTSLWQRADAVVAVEDEPLSGVRRWAKVVGEQFPDLPVIVVVASPTRRTVHDALSAGARGLVPADDVRERLAPAVRAVCAGLVVVPSELRGPITRPLISPRERQVLSMVVLGFANREIATKLYLAETTVKSHLSSAYRKLGVRSRQEATALVLDPNDGLGVGILGLSEGEPLEPALTRTVS